MAATSIDEISLNYSNDGVQYYEEINKQVLSKGAWSTVMFLFKERNKAGELGPQKVTIRRYQKVRGEYIQKSKFTISSVDQAKKIWDTLGEWFEFNP